MKILISESAGRNQAWFDNLAKKEQKAYLAAHPRSKFGAGKKASAKPAAKAPAAKAPAAKAKAPAAKAKAPAVNQTVKNKLDALRKKLATAKPADLPNIRKQIQKVREQIAGHKTATPVKRMGPPSIKRPVNRGAGNTVMGPGWKKKSSDSEWNTYEHPSGHQARVSKTAGTVYRQGMGPARTVKVHKVETKPAGQKDWSRYGEVEKYRVSDAVSRLK